MNMNNIRFNTIKLRKIIRSNKCKSSYGGYELDSCYRRVTAEKARYDSCKARIKYIEKMILVKSNQTPWSTRRFR